MSAHHITQSDESLYVRRERASDVSVTASALFCLNVCEKKHTKRRYSRQVATLRIIIHRKNNPH